MCVRQASEECSFPDHRSPGPAAVPQVLTLERHLENGDDVVQVRDEKEVRRIAGAEQIAAWARSLAPS